MGNRIVLVFFFFLPFVLFSQQNNTEKVTYEYNGIAISLFPDSTFIYEVAHCDICPSRGESDVVSFGRYVKYKDKAYYLFSSPQITKLELDVHAQENKININDSLKIELISPFEKNRGNNIFERKAVFYQVTVFYTINSNIFSHNIPDSNDLIFARDYLPRFDDSIVAYNPSYTFWQNKFTIPIYKDFTMTGFKIKIYPADYDRASRHFLWFNYLIKEEQSNYIQIEIPQFTYDYFCYESFYYKELKIINKNMVALDKIILRKKDANKKQRRKTVINWQYNAHNVEDPYKEEK